MTTPFQIAVYYFPNYHPDPRNALEHGPGWTEWELVRQAEPRFPGHFQPRIPLWGYEDESDPSIMGKKMSIASSHIINAFIFDWYWYDDGPFLEHALESGFLKAHNPGELKFAIMWANHDWIDIHPARLSECQTGSHRLLYPGTITRETFDRIVDYIIGNYFQHPAYWQIDGAPYFSFYDLPGMVRSMGGVDGLREALSSFRARTRQAGFKNLHLNQVLWNTGILPGENTLRDPGNLLKILGFDSFTSYVWIHHVPLAHFPKTEYLEVFKQYSRYWEQVSSKISLPYFPNATVGWDSSPRTNQADPFLNAGYPFTPVLSGNTPDTFRLVLQKIKTRIEQTGDQKILTVNSWNEWTEGSYLEPDTHNGMGYLEALRDIFIPFM
jgi:hypothetical protein